MGAWRDEMRRLGASGKCCGRRPQLYKSKGHYYCHKCSYCYGLNGEPLGYFASGQTEAEWVAERRAWAVANGHAT